MGSKQTCQQSFLPAEREALADKARDTEEGGSCPFPEPICPHPLVLLSPGWGTEQVHSMPWSLCPQTSTAHSPVSSGRPGEEVEVEPGGSAPEKRVCSELTAFSSPPTASPVSTTLCLPQGPPTVWSQVITHFSQPHQGHPRGANAIWLFSFSQKRLQKQNSCPPPSTSLP